ncbi:MAG: hypothetical protein Q9216_003262 [Gyalolechia sp. 2 TL-2023]
MALFYGPCEMLALANLFHSLYPKAHPPFLGKTSIHQLSQYHSLTSQILTLPMSFPQLRFSTATLTKPSTQDLEANHAHNHTNTFELIDLTPAKPCYELQPPSPLLTFAPDSPPYFPFARSLTSSSSSSSSSDLESTVKPLLLPPPFLPLPAFSLLSIPPINNTTMATTHQNTATTSNIASTPTKAPSLPAAPSTRPPPPPLLHPINEEVNFNSGFAHGRSCKWTPFYDKSDNDEDEPSDIKNDMPPGFPYEDWRGIGLLALEYLKGMQALLLGFMEQDCRWGGPRHTI